MNRLHKLGRFLLSFVSLISTAVWSAAESDRVPNEFVVVFDKQQNFSASFHSALRTQGIKVLELTNSKEKVLRLHYSDSSVPQKLRLQELKKRLPSAQLIEPNYIYRTFGGSPAPAPGPKPPADDGLPAIGTNDPFFNQLWGLRNQGQQDSAGQTGYAHADSAASKAWFRRTNASNVVVAVIDTGVDYRHPDLVDNMWQGRDPKGNLIHGFNAIADNYNPMDDNRHGTHVAGTIGAVANNGVGVSGVAWKTQIMAVKFLDSNGGGNLADAVQAIDFATQNGAQVMNNSWGARGLVSEILQKAVERARDAGVVFVAAAGNDGASNDGAPESISYPASYKLSNVISVAASDNKDQLAKFSNYGRNSVHLMAPGVKILSTTPGMRYDSFDGTSMATPHVSGAAALLLDQEPQLTPEQVRQRLIKSSDKIAAYSTKLISSGRLNTFNLIEDREGSRR